LAIVPNDQIDLGMDNADKLIDINQNGNFGAINIKGGGSLGNTISNFLAIGDIDTGGTLGGDDITGTITIADNSSDIEILGVSINSGTLGAVSIMGPGSIIVHVKTESEEDTGADILNRVWRMHGVSPF